MNNSNDSPFTNSQTQRRNQWLSITIIWISIQVRTNKSPCSHHSQVRQLACSCPLFFLAHVHGFDLGGRRQRSVGFLFAIFPLPSCYSHALHLPPTTEHLLQHRSEAIDRLPPIRLQFHRRVPPPLCTFPVTWPAPQCCSLASCTA